MENAIDALRNGAYDYLTKPFDDLDVISVTVKRAFEKIDLINENKELLDKLTEQNTELTKLNATLNELANTDGLTNLYNHRYFQEVLVQEIHRASRHDRKFSLLFLDIDNFKKYNDTYGHIHGDNILKRVAEIITTSTRKSDITARYGGEEFVVFLPETSEEGAIAYAENIRKAIEYTVFESIDNKPSGSITVSIGISVYPDDGKKPSQLIEIADIALYEAKAAGKNTVRYLGSKN
jgi:diguanylate cyclase (GGDEF)-like protein